MDALKKMVISFCIIVVSLVLLCFFRTMPSGKLWTEYRIVYVDHMSDNSYVEDTFTAFGCKDVISLSQQHVPLMIPSDAPELTLSLSFPEANEYLSKRSLYFFDKGGKYCLYYVPEQYLKEAENAVQELKRQNVNVGIDTQSVYPFAIPAICALFAIVLAVFSVHHVIFLLASCIPVLFSACVPFYPAGASVCLILYALFLALQVWRRKGALIFLATNSTVIVFVAAATLIMCVTALRCALLFIPMSVGTGAVLYALLLAEKMHDTTYHFSVVLIRTARDMPFVTKKTMNAMILCASSILFLLVISLFSVDVSRVYSRSSDMQLPSVRAPTHNAHFPLLDDYVAWCWNVETLPYRSLNERTDSIFQKPKSGDTVSFSRYSAGETGITERLSTITYDKNFYEKAVAQIDNLSYPAVEKLLKAQGEAATAGYASMTAKNGGAIHIMLMFFSLFVPTLLFIRSKYR
ncbi:MAG: hypothetical protein J6I73_09370 [Treponema sp.]|nr:hypothetical protein [Treponema sp.]